MANTRYRHKVYTLETDAGRLCLIPTLPKVLLLPLEYSPPAEITAVSASTFASRPRLDSSLTLVLTEDCNMECQYCYGYTSRRSHESMSETMIRDGINSIFEKAAANGNDVVHINFFGGEPSLALTKLAFAKGFAERVSHEKGIDVQFTVVTNGCFNKKARDFFLTNIDRFTISIDGPSDLQNRQRPLKDGAASSEKLESNIRELLSAKKDVAFRITITDQSIARMTETAAYLATLFPGVSQNYDYAMGCNRQEQGAGFDLFSRHYVNCFEAGLASGLDVNCSIFNTNPGLVFCGVSNRHVLYPNGTLSGCHRVNIEDESDEVLTCFSHGVFTDRGFIKSENTMRYEDMYVPNLAADCATCEVKWYCRGYCPAVKIHMGFGPLEPVRPWCSTIKRTIGRLLVTLIQHNLREADAGFARA